MADSTPQQLIQTALDSIQRAASLMGTMEENRTVVSGMEKAAALLEAIVPVLSEVCIGELPEDKPAEVYKPEVLDIEAMLKPIPGDNPAGINVRISGEVSSLLGLVVNRTRAADFRPQYSELLSRAKSLLAERSKDLGVAVRLIEAAVEESGFAALADGLLLVNELFSRYWDGLYPENEDDDCEARANELTKLQELLLARIYAHYGQPHEYSPAFSDLSSAEKESSVFKAIMDQLDLLDKTTDQRFGDQAPDLGELREFLRKFQCRIDMQCEAFRQSIQQQRDAERWEREQAIAAASEAVDREADRQMSTDKKTEGAVVSMEPEDVEDAFSRLDKLADFLVANAPRDPIGYLLHRCRKWFTDMADTSGGCISEERRSKIVNAFSSQQWEELLQESEFAFVEGGHRWLDLQRFQVAAAEGLGSDFAAVARTITTTTADFVSDNRKLLDDQLEDGTPCSSPETTEWIRLGIANRGSGQRSAGFGGKTDAFYTSEIERANELSDKGRPGAGMSLLHSRLQQATCSRERFLWRIVLAEYCLRNGMTEIALAAIDHLVETIDKLSLVEWEDPELFARVYKIGYSGYRRLGEKKAPVEKLEFFYRRICLYDPKHTIASEN